MNLNTPFNSAGYRAPAPRQMPKSKTEKQNQPPALDLSLNEIKHPTNNRVDKNDTLDCNACHRKRGRRWGGGGDRLA